MSTPVIQGNDLSDSGLGLLEKECILLKKTLLELEIELIKTTELLQNLFDYIQESHIIQLPTYPWSINQYKIVPG